MWGNVLKVQRYCMKPRTSTGAICAAATAWHSSLAYQNSRGKSNLFLWVCTFPQSRNFAERLWKPHRSNTAYKRIAADSSISHRGRRQCPTGYPIYRIACLIGMGFTSLNNSLVSSPYSSCIRAAADTSPCRKLPHRRFTSEGIILELSLIHI